MLHHYPVVFLALKKIKNNISDTHYSYFITHVFQAGMAMQSTLTNPKNFDPKIH